MALAAAHAPSPCPKLFVPAAKLRTDHFQKHACLQPRFQVCPFAAFNRFFT